MTILNTLKIMQSLSNRFDDACIGFTLDKGVLRVSVSAYTPTGERCGWQLGFTTHELESYHDATLEALPDAIGEMAELSINPMIGKVAPKKPKHVLEKRGRPRKEAT